MTLIILSTLFFVGYVVPTFWKYGIKSSISATVNNLKHPILFSFFEWGLAIPIIYLVRDNNFGISIGALLIAGVGLFPSLRIKTSATQDALHVFCATFGILSAYIGILVQWLILDRQLIYIVPVSIFIGIFLWALPIGKKKGWKNHTTWIEVLAYGIVILTLIYYEAI